MRISSHETDFKIDLILLTNYFLHAHIIIIMQRSSHETDSTSSYLHTSTNIIEHYFVHASVIIFAQYFYYAKITARDRFFCYAKILARDRFDQIFTHVVSHY